MITAEIARWIPSATFLLLGIIGGWLIDRIVITRLRAFSQRTAWHIDELILNALGRAVVLWAFVAGLHFAFLSLPIEIPARVTRVVTNGLFVLVALSVTAVASRAAVGFVNLYSQRVEGVLPSASIFSNLIKLLVFLVGLLIILQSLGIAITPLLTALGVGGLAVGLALQDTLSNLFSGFQIIASRQIRPGDFIKLESGEEGYIRDITWRYTAVQAISQQTVVIPNAKLVANTVTNYYQPDTRFTMGVYFSVAYESDLDRVETVTLDLARDAQAEWEHCLRDHEPTFRVAEFGDSGIECRIWLGIEEVTKQYAVRHEFMKRLHARFREEGITFPYPTRTIYLANDPTGIPPAPRPASHTPANGAARLGASADS
jgi:small-conductance mechanosensitive channel